jgi:hypothetical protein
MGRTHIVGTCGNEATIHPMVTKIAFLSDITLPIIGDRIIRAFRDAGLTAGAQVVIHDNHPVVSFSDGCLRTGLDARRFIAVAAPVNVKYEFWSIIDQFGPVLTNRNQSDPVCCPIFLLAGHLTGSTAPTEFIIYAE